jgi:hydrogenase expression/formation protein HypE
MESEKILLSHGSGGKMMHKLVNSIVSEYFDNPILNKLNDFAEFDGGAKVVMSTDSFVVSPYKFPGGDIGKLSVCGTVNDIAVSGADKIYLTCGLIIEEGFPLDELRMILNSMKLAANEAGALIVSGDTKVVEKGAADKIFINTSGVGIKNIEYNLGGEFVSPGDKLIVTGNIGDHGITIMSEREGLSFRTTLESDCAPLNNMIKELLSECKSVKCMRDPTRGGVATTLNEISRQSGISITVFEENLPVLPQVQGACELLGLDPLYVANEGKLLIFIAPDEADKALEIIKKNKYGHDAKIIGEAIEGEPSVNLQTIFGSHRIIDELTGEQLPRIC